MYNHFSLLMIFSLHLKHWLCAMYSSVRPGWHMGWGKSREKGYFASCETVLLLLGKRKRSVSIFRRSFHPREMLQCNFGML